MVEELRIRDVTEAGACADVKAKNDQLVEELELMTAERDALLNLNVEE